MSEKIVQAYTEYEWATGPYGRGIVRDELKLARLCQILPSTGPPRDITKE